MPYIFPVIHPCHRVAAVFDIIACGIGVEAEPVIITHDFNTGLEFFMLRTARTFAFLASFELEPAYTGGTTFAKFSDCQIS